MLQFLIQLYLKTALCLKATYKPTGLLWLIPNVNLLITGKASGETLSSLQQAASQ